jgi:chromosome segregation ATPase
MSFHNVLNANAHPFVPVKQLKPVQWGAIGSEKKKIKELEDEIEKIKKELVSHTTHIASLNKIIESFETSYKSLHEENNRLKISNDAYKHKNIQLEQEKDAINIQNTQSAFTLSKLWSEQIINAMLKNAFFAVIDSIKAIARKLNPLNWFKKDPAA